MAITIKTESPQYLLRKIQKAVEDGYIRTWSVDSEGDFTHDKDQWRHKAWLRPRFVDNYLIFGIISRKDTDMTKSVYGVYHGRFAEMLLTHFDTEIRGIELSSMPTHYDSI